MKPTRAIFCLLAIFALLCAIHVPARADETPVSVVNAAFKAPSIDLLPVLSLVKSPTASASIELPTSSNGSKQLMSLQARGIGPEHNWVVFSLKNPELQQQNLVLTVPHRGFIGSGVLWPLSQGSRIQGFQVSRDLPTVRLDAGNTDAVALSIAAGQSVTYAIELLGETIDGVRLWRQSAFNSSARQFAFFRGVVLGIAMLFSIGFLCLFIVRPQAIFPSASLFGWSAVMFVVLNTGQLPAVFLPLLKIIGLEGLQAIVEALMLCGLATSILTMLELRRRSLIWYALLLLVALGALGLAGFAITRPVEALGVVRMSFAGVAALGVVLVIHYWLKGVSRAQAALLPITMLAAWTVLAAIACLDLVQSTYLLPALIAGLVMVLVTMGIALAQIAFGGTIGSHYFMRDSGRRALALAGSELSVWDWQIDEGQLYVGPELERALGLLPGTVGSSDLDDWLDLIHPADRTAYFAAIETAERRGRGAFSQEFRLRRSDGTYRWFLLRARAIASREGASRLIGTLADCTAQKRAEENILADAVYDRVTGLPQKGLFLDRLGGEMRRAAQSPEHILYVLVIDLDRFKNVNDSLGPEIGDSLLDVTARRIRHLLSHQDTLARLPGDQFAVIFASHHQRLDIVAFCEQLRDVLAQPVNLRSREAFITASIGVVAYSDPHQAPAGLLEDAEIALYEAKRHGNHMLEFFTPEMRKQPGRRAMLENELRNAVERGEITVVYQPIKRLSDGQLAGFEALARWQHPTDGLRDAGSFMNFAEQTGLIKQIGQIVLTEAARQLGIWQRAFRPSDPLFVTVNISSLQLLDQDLVNDIKAVLTREALQPRTLKLELTETALVQNLEMAAKVLQRIKDLGVGLACDDFGSGYSAFSSLRRLPFDILKIDREFLSGDIDEEKSAIILESIILMAHDLRQQVIIEGIENAEQLEKLKALECDFAQGFFIGHPVSAQRVIEALGSMPYGTHGDRAGKATFWQMLLGQEQDTQPVEEQSATAPVLDFTAIADRRSAPAITAQAEPAQPRAEVLEPERRQSIWPEEESVIIAGDEGLQGKEPLVERGIGEMAISPPKDIDAELVQVPDQADAGLALDSQIDTAGEPGDQRAAPEDQQPIADEVGTGEAGAQGKTTASAKADSGEEPPDEKPAPSASVDKDDKAAPSRRAKKSARKPTKRAAKKATKPTRKSPAKAKKGPLAKKLQRAAKTRATKRKP